MRQYQLVVGGIERYAVALLDLALEGFLGNKILDLVGNGAAGGHRKPDQNQP